MSDKVKCPFKDRCTDRGALCRTCKNNDGKRSHYRPETTPRYPYPHYPPYWWPLEREERKDIWYIRWDYQDRTTTHEDSKNYQIWNISSGPGMSGSELLRK